MALLSQDQQQYWQTASLDQDHTGSRLPSHAQCCFGEDLLYSGGGEAGGIGVGGPVYYVVGISVFPIIV